MDDAADVTSHFAHYYYSSNEGALEVPMSEGRAQ